MRGILTAVACVAMVSASFAQQDPQFTQYMFNMLQLNSGDAQFSDIAQLANVASTDWSWSTLMADFDNDGWLDVFVGHEETPSQLFRNNGDGTFADVTSAAGLATQFGPALGVSTADVNGDGWIDLYVTDPIGKNTLYRNNARSGT